MSPRRIGPLAGVDEPQDCSADRGLARPGFADQPERLAGVDREVDVLHRPNVGQTLPRQAAAPAGEDDRQVFDLEQWFARSGRVCR